MPNKKSLFGMVFVASLLVGCASTASPAQNASDSNTAARSESTPVPATSDTNPGETSVAGQSTATGEDELQHVSVRLDWSWYPIHEGLRLAQSNGYYRDAGLDVEFRQGQGSVTTITDIYKQSSDIGIADSTSTFIQINEGMPLAVLGVFKSDSQIGASCYKDADVHKPKDLEGKSIVMNQSEASAQLWPGFAAANNLDLSKIKVVNASSEAILAVFASRGADCSFGNPTGVGLHAAEANPDIDPYSFWIKDYGFNVFGQTYITSQDFYNSNQELIKKFMEASRRGFIDMCSDVDSAIKDSLANPEIEVTPEFKQWTIDSMPIVCDEVIVPADGNVDESMHGYSESEWRERLQVANEFLGVDDVDKVIAAVHDDFLPQFEN